LTAGDLTGLPASGKSTIARDLEAALFERGAQVYGLDGDDLRRGLCRDLGFSPRDRMENVRRAGEVAAMFAEAGLNAIVSFISPYRRQREAARVAAAPAPFVEVFVDCPLAECVRRDPKGL
jgi:adenylyl-sulfate kinase